MRWYITTPMSQQCLEPPAKMLCISCKSPMAVVTFLNVKLLRHRAAFSLVKHSQRHRPMSDVLSRTSLCRKTMMPSLRASFNLNAGTQHIVAIIPDHCERFVTTISSHASSVNQDKYSRCTMPTCAVPYHDADVATMPRAPSKNAVRSAESLRWP